MPIRCNRQPVAPPPLPRHRTPAALQPLPLVQQPVVPPALSGGSLSGGGSDLSVPNTQMHAKSSPLHSGGSGSEAPGGGPPLPPLKQHGSTPGGGGGGGGGRNAFTQCQIEGCGVILTPSNCKTFYRIQRICGGWDGGLR